MKLILRIPFLFIILIVFNLTIISDPGSLDPEAVPFFSMPLPSGAIWHATRGDFLVIGGIILLFLEILKSTRISMGTIIEHVLSLFVFVAFLVEFIVWPAASNSTCVILMLICLLDVIGGFAISFSSARRDFNMGGIH
ncbi:MAG: hypothetical protein P1U89_13295 [Verrucomicrobiales bacterium]|nr:hypothetical protein [Verrucomicrobiales bacterium]